MTDRLVEDKDDNCYEFSKLKSLLMICDSISYKKSKEIHLIDIFKSMIENIDDKLYKERYKYIDISLNEELSQKRYDIIMVIKQFIIQNKINANLFYYIIYLFDLLIIKNNNYKIISSLEKLGLGALYISIKFFHENNNNCLISNKKYKSLYNNRYYSMQEIAKIEILCLQLINYCLTESSLIKFIELFIISKNILDLNNKNYFHNFDDSFNHLYVLIFKNLDIIMINSNEYLKYNPLYLSLFIIGFSRNILKMDKFPKHLITFYGLTNINFNYIYNELWTNFKNILNNVRYNKDNNNYLNNKYLTNDSKTSEAKSNLNRVNNNELLNNDNMKDLSFKNFNDKLFLNHFLDSKRSFIYEKEKGNQISINKNNKHKIYSTKTSKKTLFQNCSSKVKNLYKFNPNLFDFHINSSSSSNYCNNNSLIKSKTSKCIKQSCDKICINKCQIFKNIKEYKPKNSNYAEEHKNEENLTNIINSNKKYLKHNNSIQLLFKNNDPSSVKEKKYKIEEDNYNKHKITKCKSSANWKVEKNVTNKENEKEKEKENINENKIKIHNIISIRKCYKIKHNNLIQNIIINKSIKKNNAYSYNNKNEEEKTNKLIRFQKKLKENSDIKLNDNNYNSINKNNDIINKKITEKKIIKIRDELENINNKRVNIRTFYKLKNATLKNGDIIKKDYYAA